MEPTVALDLMAGLPFRLILGMAHPLLLMRDMFSEFVSWVAVLARFVHVLAAIMWIGNSLLFTWMELKLQKPRKPEEDEDLLGTLDMLHGGGVFHLQKRVLRPEAIPSPLYWFMWQSYTTWMAGFTLLCTMYVSGGGTFFLDATKTTMSGGQAVLWSLAGLLGGWITYDRIWRSPLGQSPRVAIALCFGLLLAAAAGFNTIFNGRAVFLQMGATMGSFMTANVFFHIIPNQHKFMDALRAGRPHDLKLGKAAKARSLHNHYITFSVLFLMLSAHFPQLCSADWNVPILGVIVVTLIFVKHLMNLRHHFTEWLHVLSGVLVFAFTTIGILVVLPGILGHTQAGSAVESGRRLFISQGCATCHQQGSAEIAPRLEGVFGHPQTLSDGTQVMADENYLRESILQPQAKIVKGYAPVMPTNYATSLTPEQVTDLLAYVKSLGGR
jgi:uncharacterized membrane protein